VAADSIVGRKGFLSVHKLAVAACRCGRVVCFLRAFIVQLAATIPQAAESLLTIIPHTTEPLVVIPLRQAILAFVCLHLDRYVAKACQFEDILGLLSPGNCYEERTFQDLVRETG
jgi:hypothetical protein